MRVQACILGCSDQVLALSMRNVYKKCPAPAYCKALDEDRRAALRERLRATLPTAADGSIPLTARAWVVTATVPRA